MWKHAVSAAPAVLSVVAVTVAAGTFYKPRIAACSLMPTWQIAPTEGERKKGEKERKGLLLRSAAN